MSGISDNEKRIASALSKAVTSAKRRTSRAVEAGTAAGYKYALDIHKKSKHELHLNLGGDYGYAVAQDGTLKKSEIVKGKVEVYATAEKSLKEHIADAPKSGTMGVVSAGMESAPFHDEWEVSVLKSAFRKAEAKAESHLSEWR